MRYDKLLKSAPDADEKSIPLKFMAPQRESEFSLKDSNDGGWEPSTAVGTGRRG